ncbi:TetR/AcrR family transcriptional regulator [Rathayibacter caricis]|uniref:TetR/AcrR family transcriptional regulator n=1 Tax=Rathayibacter caricis TaxID=110936 RepID=UPI001FB40EB7|nr:TetR/AcrR family transcriptional regulator [Rathayibacter caricis]MCJ1696255.1 TetR/AcrR family transcriptional regulator [Rathayibacter caricis]
MQSGSRRKAIDPRPARTRAAIYSAAAELSREPGQDISVNAIIRASGVSRGSFYGHFTGLDDLVVAMLSDAYHEISATYSAAGTADPEGSARRAHEMLVAFISERRAFLRASLDWPVGSRAHEVIIQAYADGVHDAIVARGDAAPAGVDVDDLAVFIAGGAVAVLTSWIREGDDSVPQSVMVDRLLAVMPDWILDSGGARTRTSPPSPAEVA